MSALQASMPTALRTRSSLPRIAYMDARRRRRDSAAEWTFGPQTILTLTGRIQERDLLLPWALRAALRVGHEIGVPDGM